MHGLTEIKWENNFREGFQGLTTQFLKNLHILILNQNSSLIFQSQKWVKSKIAQNKFFSYDFRRFLCFSFQYLHILNLVTLQKGSYDYFHLFLSFSRNIFHVPQWIFLHFFNLQKLNAEFYSFFKINAQNFFKYFLFFVIFFINKILFLYNLYCKGWWLLGGF